MKKVYTNENFLFVNHVKSILDNQGIDCLVRNESMQSVGVGVGTINWPEVWVRDSEQAASAESLIREALASYEETVAAIWYCQSCDEENDGHFNVCWNCQNSKA